MAIALSVSNAPSRPASMRARGHASPPRAQTWQPSGPSPLGHARFQRHPGLPPGSSLWPTARSRLLMQLRIPAAATYTSREAWPERRSSQLLVNPGY